MTDSTPAGQATQWQRAFLSRHQLGAGYLNTALQWFDPLAQTLAAHQKSANRPLLLALNGCQGSGKSTVADFLASALWHEHGLEVVVLSLDDFYLTHAERQALAASVHPLLATRGVPGTHDMGLLRDTVTRLLDKALSAPVVIPRFDKALDDRRPRADWTLVSAPVQLVLLEGWCLGATPQSASALAKPVNALESVEDPQGTWRSYSNTVLAREFPPLYELVDEWIMLQAPSFDCVFDWRRQQEQKLVASLPPHKATQVMNDESLRRFIQHYERITRDCLEKLPGRVHHLFTLNHERRVCSYCYSPQAGVRQ